VAPHRQRHRRAVEARQGLHEHRAGGLPVEDEPGRPRVDRDVQPAPDEGGLAVGVVDLPGQHAQLVRHGGVVGLDRRRDVRREELQAEASIPADRAEAAAVPLRVGDGATPVDVDAELARPDRVRLPLRGEGDRDVLQRRRAALEQTARMRRRHPPDVDAGDARVGRERPGRAGEHEPDHHERDDGDDGGPGGEPLHPCRW